ncbi:MAG: hypothetical protein H7Z75_22295 [Ferruginibacter sp.]|nr:hypothetical protein [Cytophagales bacterium]
MKLIKGMGYVCSLLVLLVGLAFAAVVHYQAEILQRINAELSRRVNGEVRIQRVNFTIFRPFPAASLTLVGLRVKDSLYHRPLLRADKVFLRINVRKLFDRRLVFRSVLIENGAVALFRDARGYSNLSAFGQPPPADTLPTRSVSFTVDRIRLRNVRISYVDTLQHKRFAFRLLRTDLFLQKEGPTWQTRLVGRMHFGGLAFNTRKGSFLTNQPAQIDLRADFNSATKQLRIRPSRLDVGDENAGTGFRLSGQFVLARPATMRLVIESPRADYQRLLPLLTPHLTGYLKRLGGSPLRIEGVLKVKATLSGEIRARHLPRVAVAFAADQATVAVQSETITGARLRGSFTNQADARQPPHDVNSVVTVTLRQGNYRRFPVTAALRITNLRKSLLDIRAATDVGLPQINPLLQPDKYQLAGGRLRLNVRYRVTAKAFYARTPDRLPGTLEGTLQLTDGECRLLSRGTRLDRIRANVRFDATRARIAVLDFRVNRNPVRIEGEIQNLVALPGSPPRKVTAHLRLSSPSLDLASVLPLPPADEEKRGRRVETGKKIRFILDELLDKVELTAQLDIAHVQLKNFSADGLTGRLQFRDNAVRLKDIRMRASGGSMVLDGNIDGLDTLRHPFEVTATVENVDVRAFFYACDNFNQRVIEHRNLQGNLHARFTFKGHFDETFRVDPASMAGDFDVRLHDGRLLDFESLNHLSRLVFRKRNFMDIQFAAITNRFVLRGTELDIQRTEVASNVLSFYVEGKYAFGGPTDLSFRVPLSNLKRRGEDYRPENAGPDAKAGGNIFIRARNRDGKLRFALDLFNRYAREKGKARPLE